jgi:hypothetical protein
MFGHSWENATARIVARDGKYSGDGMVVTYTYVADVRLPSGEMFRATVLEPTIATDFWPPNVGDEVSVLVKSNDRKVKFDTDDPRMSAKAHEASGRQAFEAAQHQPPGTPPAAWAASSDLPQALAAQLAQLGTASDVSVHVVGGDSAEGQAALRAALAQWGGAAAVGAEPVATPEARLAKLQALHAGGLLTEAEYAEQRHRILDEI